MNTPERKHRKTIDITSLPEDEQIKLRAVRDKRNEYMKKRRENKEFAEKQREYRKICYDKNYKDDEEFKARRVAENQKNYQKRKKAYIKFRELNIE